MPYRNLHLVSNHPLASNKNSYNNAFTMTLRSPVRIPVHARNIVIYCQFANVVNFFYNISSSLGNNVMYYTDDVGLPQKYTITFPNGAYDFEDINDYLKQYFISNGKDINTVKFYAQTYTGKVSAALAPSIGIKIPSGLNSILGYVADSTYFNSSLVTLYYDAPNTANFNSILSLKLNCDIVKSNFNNGQDSNLLAPIGITAPVGSLIHYGPNMPIKIDADLQGYLIDRITLSLTDQNDQQITISDNWDATIVINWDE